MCNKDTGEKQRLQKWSRGHFFIVRGSGFIDKWNPLFRYIQYFCSLDFILYKHLFSKFDSYGQKMFLLRDAKRFNLIMS